VEEGLVVEHGIGPSAGGKPPTLLGLNAEARCVVSVDLSDGILTGSVLDLRGTRAQASAPVRAVVRGDEGISLLTDVIDELVEVAPSDILGIGVGTPGVIETDGTVVEASNLGWRNVPLAAILEARYDVPVTVINNSRAAALAEYSFGNHEAENLIVVKVGNGIGAGVVLDGRIHGGEDSAAGEIGHVVVDPNGPDCFCGKRGCLETVAAIPYLTKAISELAPGQSEVPSELLEFGAREAAAGNKLIENLLNETALNLAKVLSTTVAILDIHHVVITGLISQLGDTFLTRLETEISSRVLPTLASKLELRYGHTGERAVRMGAAASVLSAQLGVL
jgi:predicted NBD/HSP70 family sugar kinase